MSASIYPVFLPFFFLIFFLLFSLFIPPNTSFPFSTLFSFLVVCLVCCLRQCLIVYLAVMPYRELTMSNLFSSYTIISNAEKFHLWTTTTSLKSLQLLKRLTFSATSKLTCNSFQLQFTHYEGASVAIQTFSSLNLYIHTFLLFQMNIDLERKKQTWPISGENRGWCVLLSAGDFYFQKWCELHSVTSRKPEN